MVCNFLLSDSPTSHVSFGEKPTAHITEPNSKTFVSLTGQFNFRVKFNQQN